MPGIPDRFLCKATAVPEDLTDKTVLDVGGYNGRMAKLCLDRGATSATVVDSQQYQQYQGYTEPTMPDGVERVVSDVMDYHEPTAVVLLMDVAYHVKNPYALFEHVFGLTEGMLCMSTRIVDGPQGYWKLLEPYEQHPDPTVVWKPTKAGLTKLLRMVGFKSVLVTYLEQPGTHEEDGLVVLRAS